MTIGISSNQVGAGFDGFGGTGLGALLIGLLLGRGNLLGGDCGGRCAAPAAAAGNAQDTILSMMMQSIQAGVANANQNAAFTNTAIENVKEAVCMGSMNAQSNFMQLQNGQNQLAMQLQNGQNQLAASAALTACHIQNQLGQTATSRDVWNLNSKLDQLECKVATGIEAIISNNNLRSQEIACLIANTAKDARIAALEAREKELEAKAASQDLTLRHNAIMQSNAQLIESKMSQFASRAYSSHANWNVLSPSSPSSSNAVNTPVNIGV